jgi:capsular polysaccharide biosynthesis protein
VVRLAEPLRPLFPYLKPAYSVGTEVVAPLSLLASRAHRGYLPTGFVATLEKAAASSGGSSWTIRLPEETDRSLPVGRPPGHPTFAAEARELIGRVALAELPDGRVLGPHAAVITGAGDLVGEVSHYFGTWRPRQHPLYLHPFPPDPVAVDGRLGVLAYQGGAVNYYHFVTDVLPRIAIAEQCADREPPERWYVPASTQDRAGLLDRLGITAERRIDSTQVPHVRAECLVVPGLPGIEQHPAWVVPFLRERLLPAEYERIPGRCLYVTRGAAKNNRAVLNEAELVTALSDRGFMPVDPGALTIDDEIRTFAEADVVVSAHGAALTNMVFMNPGALVIELFPASHVMPAYWKLAGTVPGLGYQYLCGLGPERRPDRTKMLVSDIEVDIPGLLAMLDERGSLQGPLPPP